MSQNHITEINVLTLEAVEVELAGHEVATKPFEITIFFRLDPLFAVIPTSFIILLITTRQLECKGELGAGGTCKTNSWLTADSKMSKQQK